MTEIAERALRRHVREKAIIDHLVEGLHKRRPPGSPLPPAKSRTSTGVPVEEQIRKRWSPEQGGLPTFCR